MKRRTREPFTNDARTQHHRVQASPRVVNPRFFTHPNSLRFSTKQVYYDGKLVACHMRILKSNTNDKQKVNTKTTNYTYHQGHNDITSPVQKASTPCSPYQQPRYDTIARIIHPSIPKHPMPCHHTYNPSWTLPTTSSSILNP